MFVSDNPTLSSKKPSTLKLFYRFLKLEIFTFFFKEKIKSLPTDPTSFITDCDPKQTFLFLGLIY